MMLEAYTVREIADKIQTAIDNAGDDKGHGVQSALDDLQILVNDLDEHENDELRLINKSIQSMNLKYKNNEKGVINV